jgi:hypothetical protein
MSNTRTHFEIVNTVKSIRQHATSKTQDHRLLISTAIHEAHHTLLYQGRSIDGASTHRVNAIWHKVHNKASKSPQSHPEIEISTGQIRDYIDIPSSKRQAEYQITQSSTKQLNIALFNPLHPVHPHQIAHPMQLLLGSIYHIIANTNLHPWRRRHALRTRRHTLLYWFLNKFLRSRIPRLYEPRVARKGVSRMHRTLGQVDKKAISIGRTEYGCASCGYGG